MASGRWPRAVTSTISLSTATLKAGLTSIPSKRGRAQSASVSSLHLTFQFTLNQQPFSPSTSSLKEIDDDLAGLLALQGWWKSRTSFAEVIARVELLQAHARGGPDLLGDRIDWHPQRSRPAH